MLTVTAPGGHDWANMPLDSLAHGNAMDCDFTLRAFHVLDRLMKQKKVNFVYDNLLKEVLVILAKVEDFGIQVDIQYLEKLDKILIEEVEELLSTLQKLSPAGEINPNSTIEMGSVLFTSEGFDLTPTEFSDKTKMPQITEAHLTSVMKGTKDKKAITFIETLLKYKYRIKQYKTYVKGVESAISYNGDGRIYSNYNFATVVTGRLSCSTYSVGKEKKGVSFHTLPRSTSSDRINIRNLMRADEGKVFLAADFSQAELRVLAQCCKDSALIEAFNSGKDLHSFTASLVFGKQISEVTKEERQIAKSVSFLIVYGGGPYKLAWQIKKSVGYAKDIFSAYKNAFPKVFTWIEHVHRFIRQNGYAVSLFGRRRHLPNVHSPLKSYQQRALRQGLNFVIQSSASDLMLHALKRLAHYKEIVDVDFDILATVHDSVEVQCGVDNITKVAEILQFVLPMTDDLNTMYGLDFVVPFEVDVEAGTSFGNLTEVEYDKGGHVLNLSEVESFIENA